jgi:hypothetical protein
MSLPPKALDHSLGRHPVVGSGLCVLRQMFGIGLKILQKGRENR